MFIRQARGNPISFMRHRLAAGPSRRAEDTLYRQRAEQSPPLRQADEKIYPRSAQARRASEGVGSVPRLRFGLVLGILFPSACLGGYCGTGAITGVSD